MEPLFAFAIIGLAMCFIIVKLAGDRKKLRGLLEFCESETEELDADRLFLSTCNASKDVELAALRADAERQDRAIDELIDLNRAQGREIAEWRAKDQKRRADAKRASIKGHEAQAVIAAAKRAEQAMKRQAVNDELRAITGGLI